MPTTEQAVAVTTLQMSVEIAGRRRQFNQLGLLSCLKSAPYRSTRAGTFASWLAVSDELFSIPRIVVHGGDCLTVSRSTRHVSESFVPDMTSTTTLSGTRSRYGTTKNIFVPGRNGLRACPYAVPQLTRVGLGVDALVGSQIGAVLGSRRAHSAEFRCGGS